EINGSHLTRNQCILQRAKLLLIPGQSLQLERCLLIHGSVQRVVSAATFELLARSARAGVVSPDLFGRTTLVWWADITLNPGWIRWPLKALFGSVHTTAHLFALLAANAALSPIYAAALESSNLMTKVESPSIPS